MMLFSICIITAVFVVSGDAKKYEEFAKCRDEGAVTCREKCITEISSAKHDSVQACFKKPGEAFSIYDECLKEPPHNYGPEKDCLRREKHDDDKQHQEGEVKAEAAKKFLNCKHECLDEHFVKCSEGCKDAKVDQTAHKLFQKCNNKLKLRDAKKELHDCLEKAVGAK